MKFRDSVKTALGIAGVILAGLSDVNVLPLMPKAWQPYVLGASAMLAAMGISERVQVRRRRRRLARARARKRA